MGAVDASLYELLSKIEGAGLKFAEHPTYGVITTCPTNMGTGKRQSILGQFPNITEKGKNEKRLKDLARNNIIKFDKVIKFLIFSANFSLLMSAIKF